MNRWVPSSWTSTSESHRPIRCADPFGWLVNVIWETDSLVLVCRASLHPGHLSNVRSTLCMAQASVKNFQLTTQEDPDTASWTWGVCWRHQTLKQWYLSRRPDGKRISLPVVPHKAVAEVSKIENYRRGELLWCMEGRTNWWIDRWLSLWVSLSLSTVTLSVSFSVSLSDSIYLSIHLSFFLSLYIPIYIVTFFLSSYMSIYLSSCPSIYLSIYHQSIYLSINQSIYLSISLFLSLSICLSHYISLSLSMYVSLWQSFPISVSLFIFLPIYLCVCLPTHLAISLDLQLHVHLYLHPSLFLYLFICRPVYLTDMKQFCDTMDATPEPFRLEFRIFTAVGLQSWVNLTLNFLRSICTI